MHHGVSAPENKVKVRKRRLISTWAYRVHSAALAWASCRKEWKKIEERGMQCKFSNTAFLKATTSVN
jgi:hypothetical protein